MIEIYKKKPVSVAVLAWDGRNFDEIKKFAGDMAFMEDGSLFIHTLEDTDTSSHAASVGDLIVRGVKGEFYPVKPDVFMRTYEPCSESEVEAYWHKRFENISSSLRWEPAAMLPFLVDSDYTDIASAKLDKATFDMLAERDKFLERVARQLDNTLYYNPFFPASTDSSQSLLNSCRSAMTIMHYVKPRRRTK
jgi:hypothetical protein